MRSVYRLPFGWFSVVVALALPPWIGHVSGVVFYQTGDPEFNTTAPAGSLAGSGWQFEGNWGIGGATVVGSRYFISVQHLGGNVGDHFQFGGADYVTAAFYDDPSTDLRVCKIRGLFPATAPLYSEFTETGAPVVVFGRGTQRGAPFYLDTGAGPTLRGWYWGAFDSRQRWGQNQVQSIVNGDTVNAPHPIGQLLRMTFDAGGGPNESTLSTGDSGGGLFALDQGTWKLTGVNYAVDSPYNTTSSGPGFVADIFDERGLYKGGDGNWTLVNNGLFAQPGAFYSIRISARLDWINGILAQSDAGEAPVLQASAQAAGPYVDTPSVVDETTRTITATASAGAMFYRLRGLYPFQMTGVAFQGGQVHLTYE